MWHHMRYPIQFKHIKNKIGLVSSKHEKILKKHIKKEVADLMEMDCDERIEQRIDKFGKMGEFNVADEIMTK